MGTYSAGALLLDPEMPQRVIRRSREAISEPEAAFETIGFAPDVLFPTGLIQRRESLLVYYGAADTSTAVVEFSLSDLLDLLPVAS